MTFMHTVPVRRGLSRVGFAAVLGLGVFQGAAAQADTAVDVELQLLMDVSGSISSSEYALQMDGYAYSFREQSVQDAILDQSNGRYGSIAVQSVMWSSQNRQSVMTEWTLLDSVESIESYADTLQSMDRPFSGTTYNAEALEFGGAQFKNNGFAGTRNVIDMSGDGYGYDYMYGESSWFSGGDTSDSRDAVLASGVDTINGLTITHDYWEVGDQDLTTWFSENVAGGQDAFVIEANGFGDFSSALTTKLTAEIEGGYTPEGAVQATQGPVSSAPGPVMGSGTVALLGLMFVAMKRRRKSA